MIVDLVFTDAATLDMDTLRALRSALPVQRRERSDRYDRAVDRHASVVVFAQLQRLWWEHNDGQLPDIRVGEFGKPDFDGDVGLHFNWSHDSARCACIVASSPVGVDVSGRVSFDDDLFRYMAAPGEMRLRERLKCQDDLSAIWTRKEAMVKRDGQGLSRPLSQVDTTARDDILTLVCASQGFSLSMSVDGMLEQELAQRLRIRFLTPAAPDAWVEGPAPCLRRLGPELL